MKLAEYAALVDEMREAQNEFFAYRVDTPQRREALKTARAAERRVDRATRDILDGQGTIAFDPDDRGPTKPAA